MPLAATLKIGSVRAACHLQHFKNKYFGAADTSAAGEESLCHLITELNLVFFPLPNAVQESKALPLPLLDFLTSKRGCSVFGVGVQRLCILAFLAPWHSLWFRGGGKYAQPRPEVHFIWLYLAICFL